METKSLTLLQCVQCSAVYAVVGNFSMQIGSLTVLMIKHNANCIIFFMSCRIFSPYLSLAVSLHLFRLLPAY